MIYYVNKFSGFLFTIRGNTSYAKLASINNLLRLSSQMLSSSQGNNAVDETWILLPRFCSSYAFDNTWGGTFS